jgi:hypothetical protein
MLLNLMLLMIFVRTMVPISSLLVQAVAPVPLAIITTRHGMKAAAIGTVVSCIVALAVFGVTSGIWAIFYSLVGLAAGQGFRIRGAFALRVLLVSAAYTLLFAAALLAVARLLGWTPTTLGERLEYALSVVRQIGILDRNNTFPPVPPLLEAAIGFVLICVGYSAVLCIVLRGILRRLPSSSEGPLQP